MVCICAVYLLNFIAVVERPVTRRTKVVIVRLMLRPLLLVRVSFVTSTTLVLEVVLAVHMLKRRVVRLEVSITTVALEKGVVTSVFAMLIARSLFEELLLTNGALVGGRDG